MVSAMGEPSAVLLGSEREAAKRKIDMVEGRSR